MLAPVVYIEKQEDLPELSLERLRGRLQAERHAARNVLPYLAERMREAHMAQQNAFYAQSGGVTAVINASAAGVIETARQHADKIGKVYAGRHGIIGALTEELIDTSQESAAAIARLKHTPGGAFGSARYKLKSVEEGRAQYERLLEVFQAHNIGYFFYNGGGDSADTCLKVAQVSAQLGFPMVTVHIPKTVDNDLPITDCCPGFGSVAKYVATSIREAAFDVASMARTSTRVFILEVMGRHTGWIAAACGLAAEQEGEAPHILLFPEIPLAEEPFLARVEAVVQQHGYCVIGAAEGLRHADGSFLAGFRAARRLWPYATGRRGAGNCPAHTRSPPVAVPLGGGGLSAARCAPSRLPDRCAAGLCGWPGRGRVRRAGPQLRSCRPSCACPTDPTHGLSVWPSWRRSPTRKSAYRATLSVPTASTLPPRCRTYLTPLIQGEDWPPFKNGLPDYATLKNLAVPKKLHTDFKL